MRKLIWACTACGVLLAGGLFWATQHAVRHPETMLGHALTGASKLAVLLNPSTGVAPMLAEKVWHTSTKVACEEQETAGEVAPPDPVPAGDPAPEPKPEDPVTDPVPSVPAATSSQTPLKVVGQIQVSNPPLIVIPEEEPLAPPQEQATADLATFQTAGGQTELTVVPGSCPTAMPRCDTDEDELPMPAEVACEDQMDVPARGCATDTCARPEKMEKCEIESGWFYHMLHMWDEEACESEEDNPDANYEQEHEAAKAAQEDHQQYCPYTGKCYPACDPDAEKKAEEQDSKPQGSEEDSEEPQSSSEKKEKKDNGEDTPMHFEVDTMEFRASDGNLADYGPGSL